MLTGRAWAGTPVMSWPSMKMRPALGVSKPASIRSSVVLPQPEPPSSAKSSPLPIASDTSSTAVKPPKRLLTASRRTKAGREAAGVVGHGGAQPVRTSVQARAIARSCSGVQAGGAHIRFTVASSG